MRVGNTNALRRFGLLNCVRFLIAIALLGGSAVSWVQGAFPWETRGSHGKVPAHIEIGRMMTVAGQFERQKNYAKAAAIYRQVLARNNGHLEAQKRLDFAMAQLGEPGNSPTTILAQNQAHPIPTTIPQTTAVEEVTTPQRPVVDRLIVKMPESRPVMAKSVPNSLPKVAVQETDLPVAQEESTEPEEKVTPVPTEREDRDTLPRLTEMEEEEAPTEPRFLSVKSVAHPHPIVPPLTRKVSLWRAAKPLPEDAEVVQEEEKISSPFRAMLMDQNGDRSTLAEDLQEQQPAGVVRLSDLSEESPADESEVINTSTEREEGRVDDASVAEPEADLQPRWRAHKHDEGVIVASGRTSTKVVVSPLPTEVETRPAAVKTSVPVKSEEKTLVSSQLQDNTEYRSGLIGLCPRATQEIRRLIRSMETPSVRLRKGSLLRLCEAGPAAESALPAVREMLLDRDDSVRVMAARCLWKIHRETTGLQALQDVAAKGSIEETCLAAYTLGEMGQSAQEAVPVLEHLCKTRSGFVRLHAAEAVWKIKGNDETSLTIMIEGLNSTEIGERWLSAYILSASGTKRLAMIDALNQTLDDREPAVQSSAAFALGCLGKEASMATPRLVSMFESTSLDQHLRVTAFHALSNIEPLTAQKFTKISVQKPSAQTFGHVRR